MKPSERPPVNPIDRDVAEAFAALDRMTPELDDFSSRVLARLDDGEGARPPADAAADDSGLHDIVALAHSARRRISERGQSESDDESAVLLAVAHGGLRAVALPDPVRGRPRGKTAGHTRERIRAETRSSAPFWVLGSVASIAAAAAVAVFVFGIGRRDRAGLAQVGGETAEPAAEPALPPNPAPEPSAVPPASPAAAPAEAPPERPLLVDREEPALRWSEKKNAAPRRRTAGQTQREADAERNRPVAEERAAAPARGPLEPGDLARAIEEVGPAVEGCAESGPGATVLVKLVVAPTGQVSSAEPTGAHAGTALGACVADAAKRARFREFDGGPSSFEVPFVLPGSP